MRQHNRMAACQQISLCILVAASCLTLSPLLAQQQFGLITGLITDPSGAVIPGATVVVTNDRHQGTVSAVPHRRRNRAGLSP